MEVFVVRYFVVRVPYQGDGALLDLAEKYFKTKPKAEAFCNRVCEMREILGDSYPRAHVIERTLE